jgi:hypothetical protein
MQMMFGLKSRLTIMATALSTLMACGSANKSAPSSQLNSVIDQRGRVFGLVKAEVSDHFEFKYCRDTSLPREVLDDPKVCINPFLDEHGEPITLKTETFPDYESAARYLSNRGYVKGAALMVPAAVGAFYAAAVGSAVLLTAGVGLTENVLVATALAAPAAGGAAGFSIWGRSDREVGRNLEAIFGDFYRAKSVDDSLKLVRRLADVQGYKINPAVTAF